MKIKVSFYLGEYKRYLLTQFSCSILKQLQNHFMERFYQWGWWWWWNIVIQHSQFFDTDLIIIFTQGFRHWTMKIRLLCWKGLQLKLCFSVQLRFSVRNFQLDMLTYWKREFERAVSNLANGKKFVPASKNLYIPWRQASCLSYAVICPLWLA